MFRQIDRVFDLRRSLVTTCPSASTAATRHLVRFNNVSRMQQRVDPETTNRQDHDGRRRNQ
jgi:hypothetical protein